MQPQQSSTPCLHPMTGTILLELVRALTSLSFLFLSSPWNSHRNYGKPVHRASSLNYARWTIWRELACQ